ncbi:MAG: hypothetical protein G01um10145_957 [Microgenomates group bacterium Gr01-1014_5]|nr:MAG: hypothetical protein G01um10145_957 [Microgenomates group bacterium Gr01-1014_5]
METTTIAIPNIDNRPALGDTISLVQTDKRFLEGRVDKLKESLREMLQHISPNLEDEAVANLDKICDRGLLDSTYSQIVGRIKGETFFFKDLEKLGILDRVLWDLPDLQDLNGVPVRWSRPLGYRVGGNYRAGIPRISISKEPASKFETIEFLLHGALPPTTSNLIHEGIHAVQDRMSGTLWESYPNRYRGNPELFESTAKHYQGIPESMLLDQRVAKMEEYFTFFKNKISQTDKDKIFYAIHALERLSSLGADLPAIIRICRNPGGWNRKKKQYDDVQRVINKNEKTLRLSKDEADDLLECYEIEKAIEVLAVQIIVQNELRIAAAMRVDGGVKT